MIFLDHNIKLHKMIEMHSKYDNMHTNRIFNALNCINNHVNSCMNCMLAVRNEFSMKSCINMFYLNI